MGTGLVCLFDASDDTIQNVSHTHFLVWKANDNNSSQAGNGKENGV